MLKEGFGQSWDELVPINDPEQERSAVVVVAPAGFGKSTELSMRAEALRKAGVHAFHLSAVELARSGLVSVVHDLEAFRNWKTSSERAVFFIDALDEARMAGYELSRVLFQFEHDVDQTTKRVQLVLSTRNDIWTEDDRTQLGQRLALRKKEPPIKEVRLEPLALDDLRHFADSRGIPDVEAFISAVLQDELEQLLGAIRPADANVLIEYWKSNGTFGPWSEMIDVSIEANTRNENRAHTFAQQFTTEEARGGLARLAAATVLGRRPLVSMPGVRRDGQVSVDRLFIDKRPIFVSQLLQMGLLVQKGGNAVQLPQGAVSEYLAAVWLAQRVRRGWDPEALEKHFLIAPHQHGRVLLPESRRAVAGWVSGLVPQFRRRLLRILPEVALFDGDPSKMSRGECVQALRDVLVQVRTSGDTPHPTAGTIRQIAKHNIAGAVHSLLKQFDKCDSAEYLLLRIARAGRYEITASRALKLALDQKRSVGVRITAIGLVGVAGAEAERRKLLPLAEDPSEGVKLEVVRALVPALLHGKALVDLVVSITEWEVAFMLSEALDSASLSDIDDILSRLIERLAASPSEKEGNAQTKLLTRLTASRLRRDESTFPDVVPRALLAVESLVRGPFFVPAEVVAELEQQLTRRNDLRRALWERRLANAKAKNSSELITPRLGLAQPADIEWLMERRLDLQDEAGGSRLDWVISEILNGMSQAERRELVKRAGEQSETAAWVREFESSKSRFDEIRKSESVEKDTELGRRREDNILVLNPRRELIESGTDRAALEWAWNNLNWGDTKKGRIGTGRLVEAVGSELTDMFFAGFSRWWRNHDAALPELGSHSTPTIYLAGLTGLTFDVERGLDFATLSTQEVERAFCYALHELNGLPTWFEAFRKAQPSQVKALLAKVVHAEWVSTVQHYGLIATASHEPTPTAQVLRDLIWEEFERAAPGHSTTLHNAVDALILGSNVTTSRAKLFARGFMAAEEAGDSSSIEWLRGWSHFAPRDAASWLQELKSSNRPRFRELLEGVSDLLETDFNGHSPKVVLATWTPQALELWIQLMHVAVRPEDDIDRSNQGAFSPGRRDGAQGFRRRLLSKLARDPSRSAYEALQRLEASKEMAAYSELIAAYIDAQLRAAAEQLATPWDEKKVLDLERGDERPPETNTDLFSLVQLHLTRVRRLIENDEFGYAALFRENTPEKHVQRWVASSLKLVSQGLYTIEREPEVQDNKLIDISITVPGVGCIPIEIKPISKSGYSLHELRDCMSQQLVGRYMRPPDVDRGILLVVVLKERKWTEGRRRLSLEEGLENLRAHAKRIGAKYFKEVAVMHIDIASARGTKTEKVTKNGKATPRHREAVRT
jgi:hypothetical protein